MFISLIIPVYNAEKYLVQCLESAVHQSFSQYEILLVDDASTDDSGKICMEYQKQYPFVRLIQHTQNQGVMQSWQDAVCEARGDYIAFLDSDDWVSLDYLKNMAAASADGADIVCCNHNRVYGEMLDFQKEQIAAGCYDRNQIREIIFPVLLNNGTYLGRSITPHRWGKLFRKELLLNNLKYCDSRVSYGDDVNIFFPAIQDCRMLTILEDQEGLYFYRQNDSSIVHSYKKEMYQQISCLRRQLLVAMQEKAVYDFKDQVDRDFWCLFLEYVKNEAQLGTHWATSKVVLHNFRISMESVPFVPLFRKKSDYLLLRCLRSNSRVLVYGWLNLYTTLRKV